MIWLVGADAGPGGPCGTGAAGWLASAIWSQRARTVYKMLAVYVLFFESQECDLI